MGELVFVGLGLYNEKGICMQGLEELKSADEAFIELYTTFMSDFSTERLEEVSGKKLRRVAREDLEEKDGESLLRAARTGKAVFLVPGDPLIATTHVTLRIQAEKSGIRTRIVHGASILSAVMGLSGLHNYKFGKSVTIPFSGKSETPYQVVAENKARGLHTLCLLDVMAEENRFMRIHQGLEALLSIEENRRQRVITADSLVVGIAQAGSPRPTVKAGLIKDLMGYDFGKPPHSIIVPGDLHFMEAEALIHLAGGPERLRKVAE